jgi:glutathione synthase
VLPLTAFDAVLMRQDPPFDFEYVAATWLLERAEAEGARIWNKPRSIRDHSEKVAITEFPQFTPTTLIARDPADIHAFIDELGDVILKPLDGMGGSSIFRVLTRRPQPQRHRRDADGVRRAQHHGAALPAGHQPTATSASC